MNAEALLFLESAIKYATLSMGAYALCLMSMPQKPSRTRFWFGVLCMLLLGVVVSLLKNVISPLHYDFMMTVLIAVNLFITRSRLKKAVTQSVMAYIFCQTLFMLSGFLGFCLLYWVLWFCSPDLIHNAASSHESPYYIVTSLLISLFFGVILWLVTRSRLFQRGMQVALTFCEKDSGLFLSIMLICIETVFISLLGQKSTPIRPKAFLDNRLYFSVLILVFGLLLLFWFSIVFWILYEIRTGRQNRKQDDDIALLTQGLTRLRQESDLLLKDNEQLAAVIHKDNKLIPALVGAAQACAAAPGRSDNAGILRDTAAQLEEIRARREAAVAQSESHGARLPSTGLALLDALLGETQRKAEDSGIRLTVDPVDFDLTGALERVGLDIPAFCWIVIHLTEGALRGMADKAFADRAIRLSFACVGDRRPELRLCGSLSDASKKGIATQRRKMKREKDWQQVLRRIQKLRADTDFRVTSDNTSRPVGCLRITFGGSGIRRRAAASPRFTL